MAHMIPNDIPATGPGAHAERVLFEALRETLWDVMTPRRLGPAVEETFRFWRGEQTVIPPSGSEFKDFRRNALQPVLNLIPTLGAKLVLFQRDNCV